MEWFYLKKSVVHCFLHSTLHASTCNNHIPLYCSQLKQLMLASNGYLRTTTCCHVTQSTLHNSCMCMQSLLFYDICFMAYVNNLKFKAYSILVMFILTYQFLWFWSHSKDLHDPENNLWYSIITYVTHEGWITPTLRIYILSFSSITSATKPFHVHVSVYLLDHLTTL